MKYSLFIFMLMQRNSQERRVADSLASPTSNPRISFVPDIISSLTSSLDEETDVKPYCIVLYSYGVGYESGRLLYCSLKQATLLSIAILWMRPQGNETDVKILVVNQNERGL